MKYNLTLVGPQASGKTTFTEMLINKTAPKEYRTTDSQGEPKKYKRKWYSFLSPKIKILDAGGNSREQSNYKDWFKESDKIAFVFNGIDLINEVKDCEKGGRITSFCRKICNMIGENEIKAPLYFIATHKDEFNENEDFNDKIRSCISEANENYKSITSDYAQRYPFYKDMLGRLFSLDARDRKSVEETFRGIIDNNN